MNKYLIVLCLLFVMASSKKTLCQQQANELDNVTISSSIEQYEFIKGYKDHPVLIKGQLSTTYNCNGFRTSVPFIESYNDHTSIDDVVVYINKDVYRNVTPSYSYYPVEDVFYSDERICYFDVSLEKKNSQSSVVIKKTINDPRYFTTIYFGENYYLLHKEVSIKVPNWMKLEIREYNFPPGGLIKKTEQKDNTVIYTYALENIPARKFPEYAPGGSYVYPHLLFLMQSARPDGMPEVTFFRNIQDQYNWYRSLVQQINNDPSSFRKTVEELVRDKHTDTEKIQAVFQWVQANIRYIAFEDGIAAFKPESAQEVYRRKYGDCKGMANLTKEMLKILGYDARLCWLGTNHIAYDYSTPSLAVDNHVICAVRLNNSFIFLDATEKYIALGEYAERIQGRKILIEDGEHYLLETIPVRPLTQNTIKAKRLLKIDSGNITGNVSLTFKGESKEYLHFGMNSIASNKREITLREYLSGNNVNYQIKDLVVTGLQDWNKDISVQYSFSRINAVAEFSDEKYVNFDWRNDLADLKIDSTRDQDVWLPYRYQFIDTTELTIPDGYVVEQLPKAVSIKNETYLFNLQYTSSGKMIIYTKEIALMSSVIKKQQFKSWNTDLATLNNFYKEQIILKKN